MSENPAQEDPSAQWPEEVKQAYENLKIPSLYDAVLANEKLSLEIRRQDRDLKTLAENVQGLSSQLNAILEVVSEEWEEIEMEGDEDDDGSIERIVENVIYRAGQEDFTDLEMQLLEDKHGFLEKQAQETVIEAHEAIRDLSHSSKQVARQLLALLPKTEGLATQTSSWYPVAEEMIQGLLGMVDQTRYKFLARLELMQIEIIEPQPGDEFNEFYHRALEHTTGGRSGTIERVIRPGYRQNQQMLRPAEVTVYS